MRRTLVDLGLLAVGGFAGLCLAIAWASRQVRAVAQEGWD